MMQNNKTKTQPIGIFDSGIGGVTVLKELIKQLPNENYIYYSDSKNNPYGEKTDEQIIQITDNITKYLIDQNCKAIIIACNTASAKASKNLREKYTQIPIIAIEPACKVVHDLKQQEPTLIMATKGTIESERFHLLTNKYANNQTYILQCTGLAELIENEDQNEKIQSYLQKELQPYKGKIKNVILGCTHYPLIKQQITNILGKVQYFDGSKGLSKHAKSLIIPNTNQTQQNQIQFIDSTNNKNKEKRFFQLLY